MIGLAFDPPSSQDVDAAVEHIHATVGTDLPPHPGGWPDEIEKALIDAVFSARAAYGSPSRDSQPATGVHRVLEEWTRLRAGTGRGKRGLDDLTALRTTIEANPRDLASINAQKVPGRSTTRPTKWQAVDQIAAKLLDIKVSRASDVAGKLRDPDDYRRLHDQFTAISGVADATFSYFLMLLGHPGVKAGTMVRAFLDEALRPVSTPGDGNPAGIGAKRAQALLIAAAERLQLDVLRLDHAVWNHQRAARRGRN